MQIDKPLIEGVLIKRYKRFLADIALPDGRQVTAHTPNTGAMTGCCEPGSRVWLRDSENPKRKYPLSWELVEVQPRVMVGINTGRSNRLVEEAITDGTVVELSGYTQLRREVPYGEENSRIDLLLEGLLEDDDMQRCYVEVKNVTLVEAQIGLFPDAISTRGTKHLRELIAMVKQGHRAVIFYCLQRHDATEIRPADAIDPVYGETLRQAINQGVEAFAYGASVSPTEIILDRRLAVRCP